MATTLSPVRAGAKDAPGSAEVVPEKPKKSKKKLIIILVVVLLAAGVGYKMTLGKAKAAGPAKPVKGAVLKLDSVSLNLAGGHFLKLGIALQETKKASAEFDGSQATDLAISQFSGMTMDDLSMPGQARGGQAGLPRPRSRRPTRTRSWTSTSPSSSCNDRSRCHADR